MKWLLLGVALLLVIAITVGVTLLFTRDGDEDNPPIAGPTTSAAASDIASANDTGPVSIITEDPTCDVWRPIGSTLADQERNGWDTRDPSIPVAAWTPDQRAQHEAVGEAMRTAADQTIALVKMTPHRAMRELYEQTIAYWRAYADSIPTYSAPDNALALVANGTSSAIVSICASITYGSAASRGPLAGLAASPSIRAPIGDPSTPKRFLVPPANPVCADWINTVDQFRSDTADWRGIDPNIPAAAWNSSERAVTQAAAHTMQQFAGTIRNLGDHSANATWQDFSALASQYWLAYSAAVDSYTPADNYLAEAAALLTFSIEDACDATRTG